MRNEKGENRFSCIRARNGYKTGRPERREIVWIFLSVCVCFFFTFYVRLSSGFDRRW